MRSHKPQPGKQRSVRGQGGCRNRKPTFQRFQQYLELAWENAERLELEMPSLHQKPWAITVLWWPMFQGLWGKQIFVAVDMRIWRRKDLGKSTSWMVLPDEALDYSQIFRRRKEHFFTAEEEGGAELVLQVKGHRRSCHNQKCFEEFLGLIVLKIVFPGSPYWDLWKFPLITCVSSRPTTKVLKPSRTTLDIYKFTYYSVTVL